MSLLIVNYRKILKIYEIHEIVKEVKFVLQSNLTDPNLIEINIDLKTKEDVLKKMATILFKNGYVKETYINAILEREKRFPTGIENNVANIAIPHADSEHVLKPGLAVGVLKNTVNFNRMDDPEQKIPVKIVFMLAIKNPQEQLNSLKDLMNLIRDCKSMGTICKCNSSKQVFNILKEEQNSCF